jgi:hypothetical protein
MSEDSSEDNIEISGSSYARLFNNGTNIQLSNDIGKLFTTFHSKSIKQGNNLEEFINEFINNETHLKVFKEPKKWFEQQTSLENIFKDKKVINKCFIPKKYFTECGVECSNKSGIELDYIIINPDKSITCIEMKAGKNFDTKKSKGEISSLMNIKEILTNKGILVKELLIVSYEATTSTDISIKTDLKDVNKITFLTFLKRFLESPKAHEGKIYLKNKFEECADENLILFRSEVTNLLDRINSS